MIQLRLYVFKGFCYKILVQTILYNGVFSKLVQSVKIFSDFNNARLELGAPKSPMIITIQTNNFCMESFQQLKGFLGTIINLIGKK